ncbi:MAG TPA: VOC family protein [Edaphocola sp.]|nr:VOC family protein [Edaphocola sp.]
MKVVNPYLNFPGNAEDAFNFYKSVFGGEFSMLMRMKDAPGMPIPEGQEEKIMHIALPLNSGQVLMASDNCNAGTFKDGNNAYISIHADSVEEGQKLYDALVAGGNAQHPFEKQFWGSWHGNLKDKFGIHWMVNYDEPAR